MKKAVFIDKDGTLIKDVSYNIDTKLIEFEPLAFEALELLQRNGYLLVIVTNQAGIAFGYFTEEELEEVHIYIRNTLKQKGIFLNGFYFCPHHISGKLQDYAIACNCQKPAPGLILKAASDMQIDLTQSWMIGDILNDMEAGNLAGCKTILINNGNETEWQLNKSREPFFIVKNLLQAAEIIVAEKNE
jgi:D-glycero-D-manno-heptose 1,7-bisphosphate phosphatase